MGILPSRVRALPQSWARSEAGDAERILLKHRVPPEICDSPSEWTATGKASGAAATRTKTAVWPANALHSGGDLGSGGISLVGAAEGLAAELDALDSQALSAEPRDGETTAGHQCAANRSTFKGEEERAETEYLRTDQAGLVTKAPHSGEDGQLGRDFTRVQRDRPGGAFGQFGGRRLCAFAELDRHTHGLDGVACPTGEESSGGARSSG